MASVTLPGTGVIVPPDINVSSSLSISACTTPGNLSCIYWGDHLTINNSTTPCQIRIKNNSNTPLTLKMKATFNGRDATIDSTNPIPPRAQGVSWDKENAVLNAGDYLNATLRLHIAHAMMPPQDIPFITQVTISGTPP